MPQRARTALPTASLLPVAALLALTGCEIRQEGEPSPEDQPALETPATPEPTPEVTPSEAPVSIIREEIIPVEPVDIPPEPLAMVLPFPDGADVTSEAETLLEQAMQSEAMQEGWPVVLGGHTDSSGNDQANLRASRARAEAVAAWLVEHGVADERIEVVAFGEQNPIAPNALPDGTANETGRRANRRVELQIAPPPEVQPVEPEPTAPEPSASATPADEGA